MRDVHDTKFTIGFGGHETGLAAGQAYLCLTGGQVDHLVAALCDVQGHDSIVPCQYGDFLQVQHIGGAVVLLLCDSEWSPVPLVLTEKMVRKVITKINNNNKEANNG